MATFTVRGIPINVTEIGDGRPVLMLHGWPGDHRFMVHHYEPIFEKRQGWRRIYPDMPGMGSTPAPDWITTGDDLLEVALDLADVLAADGPLVLIGASWGAYLALAMLHRRPERVAGVMLVTPTTSMSEDRDVPEPVTLVQDPGILERLQQDEQLWAHVAVVQTEKTLAAFRAAVKPGLQAADAAFLERMDETLSFSLDVAALPAPFPGPALILCGRQDSLVGYRHGMRLSEQFPRGTIATLDRAGHAVQEEQQALFHALAHEWLDRVEEHVAPDAG